MKASELTRLASLNMKYTYTALFTPEKNGMFSVGFPDLPGCYTSGDDLADAIYMAQDVLNLTLYDMEQDKTPIPKASYPKDILVKGEQFTSVIVVDTDTYRQFYKQKEADHSYVAEQAREML